MEWWKWDIGTWATVFNAVGVVGGLFLTARALRSETKTRRIANLLTITTNHREIWKEFFKRPDLARVLDVSADLATKPIAADETEFVNFVILHLNSVYYALKEGMTVEYNGLRRDVRSFFSLPIPRAVWEKTKIFQNEDFVKFVESCQLGEHPR